MVKIAFVFNRQILKTLDEAEFDTTETIEAITRALESGGNEVIQVEMTRDFRWIERLISLKPELIFNTAEGFCGIGRESLGPVTFEQLNIPYVGPGPYACFLTLDKFLTKQMVSVRGIAVADGHFVTSMEELKLAAKDMTYPAFIKPNYEGSSKGISHKSICENSDALIAYGTENLPKFPEGLLVEKFLPGKDISVGYLGDIGKNGVLEPIEYVTKKEMGDRWIYSYELKNLADEDVSVLCPAQIPPDAIQKVKKMMRRIVSTLGIVDFGRADFRYTPEGEIYFVEFNALPSLQPGAGMFESTKLLGLNYNDTILKIVEAAQRRMKIFGARKRPNRRLRTRKPTVGLVYNLRRKQSHEPGFEAEAEFDSQSTIDAIRTQLEGLHYPVVPLEATRNLPEQLKDHEIDVVYNIAEGQSTRAREAQVPAICELLGLEHTGSDSTCLALTLDKQLTSRLVSSEGILTPKSALINVPPSKLELKLNFPVIVKPNQEGTSKGISDKSVALNLQQAKEAIDTLWNRFRSPILCEEYIEGREFTIGVIGRKTLKTIGPMEITFKERDNAHPVYSFEAKMSANPVDNEYLQLVCPVTLEPKMRNAVERFAKKAFRAVGCRDIARIDFKVDSKNNIYFLEINPLPGLAPGFSDLVIMADKSGMKYSELIKTILDPAVQRWRESLRPKPGT